MVLELGAVLASRYRVDEELPGDFTRPVFVGTDQKSDRRLVVYGLEREEADRLEKALGIEHAHLAKLFAVVREGEAEPVLVAEHVTGVRLDERLAVSTKQPVDAVRSLLRIADAVAALHAAQSAHGSLRPRAIVVEPDDGRVAPTVTWLPGAVTDPYCSPERGAGGPGSAADDEWALASLLFEMMTGKTPPASGFSAPSEIVAAGIHDDALAEAIFHGAMSNAAERSHELRPLKRELARWFAEHADEAPHASRRPSHPPPLPGEALGTASASAAPSASVPVSGISSSTMPTRKSARRLPLFAAAGIAIGLLAAWGVASLRARPKVKVVEIASAAPSGSEKQIALGDVPVTGESKQLSGDKTATCVAGYLPKGAFARPPDVAWVCAEKDPRAGAVRLRAAIVQGAPPGGPSEAMKIMSRIGWYDMAAFAVVRVGCCQDARIELPDTGSECGKIDQALSDMAHAVIAGQPYEASQKAYEKAIHCELNAGKSAVFRRATRPQPVEANAFADLVKAVQTP